MQFLESCGSFFSGPRAFEEVEDDGEDPEDDLWRSIQTHRGEIIQMRPQEAEVIDPLDFPEFEATPVMSDPDIKIYPGFLCDEEVEHVLELTSGDGSNPGRWKHSRVGAHSGDYKKGKESGVRTSSSCTLRRGETSMIREIERRLGELVGIDTKYLENLAPVRYARGQQYRPHHDGSGRPVTVFIYLNDLADDAEGETYFPVLNVKFVPRKGAAVIWKNPVDPAAGESKDNEDSRMLHAGLPPREGLKYGLNCFFNIYPQTEGGSKKPAASASAPKTKAPPAGPTLPVSAPVAAPVSLPISLPPLLSTPLRYPPASLAKPALPGSSLSSYRCAAAPLSPMSYNSWTRPGVVACN